MPSINFTINSIEFDFEINENDNHWYSKSKYKDYIIEVSANKDIFENEKTIQKLQSFGKLISENIEIIIQKTISWTENLYNELGSFEKEKGYFDKSISIYLKNIEIETFYEFESNMYFFSKMNLIMDINYIYNVQFKSVYDKIFVVGISKE